MKKIVYINTENELKEYAENNGQKRIDDMIEFANQGKEYYSQFKDIEGCEVLYAVEGVNWDEVYMCIRWKGVCMRANNRHWYFEEKTHSFRLCGETDWQGINGYGYISKGETPQKIGKPTAKKLDNWRTYLLDYRRREEECRDYLFAAMVAKIEEVKKNFPEAQSVKWEKGYWTFEKVNNGLEYTVQINTNGHIFEKLEFATYQQKYNIGEAEKAARMMSNGLNEIKPIDNDRENSYELIHDTNRKYVSQFIGGRPF